MIAFDKIDYSVQKKERRWKIKKHIKIFSQCLTLKEEV